MYKPSQLQYLRSSPKKTQVVLPSPLIPKKLAPPLDLDGLNSLQKSTPNALKKLQEQYDTLLVENQLLLKCCRQYSNGGSRRFRKDKRRSAARRRNTVSRRRYKTRK